MIKYLVKPKYTGPLHAWLAVFWLVFGIIGVFTPIKESIPVLFFISVYANFAGHWSGFQGVKAEESD